MEQVAGLVLAAGSGSRMGGPKALLTDAGGVPFVRRAVRALHDGGCAPLVVVAGAAAEEVAAAAAPTDPAAGPVDVVVAADWREGMGASLRAGLAHLEGTSAAAALVTLVDLPGVGPAVVRRLLASVAGDGPALRSVLARACFGGTPGHPVLVGRDHWPGVAAAAVGDRGARDYLRDHPAVLVECGDVGSGEDLDTPADLARHTGAVERGR